MKQVATIACLFLASFAFGQQDIQFTQYMTNKLLVNPGYAGIEGAMCANLIARSQWRGFDGAPESQNFNFHMPVKVLKGGVGLAISNDVIGREQNFNLRLSYSYHRDIGTGRLGVGLGFGLLNKSLNGTDWTAPDGSNGSNDPSIPQGITSQMTPDLNFGAYYKTDRWFASLALTHLVPFEAELDAGTSIRQKQHLYLLGGYNFELSPELELKPTVLIKSDLASTSFDVNALAVYNKRLVGGVSYRVQDAVAVLVGMTVIDNLRVIYSYDITTSQINNYGSGSHELSLSYCFTIERPPAQPERYRNVRFL